MTNNKFLPLLFLSLLSVIHVFAQGQLGNYQSASFTRNKLVVKATNGYIEVVPYSATIISVTYKRHLNEVDTSYSTIAKAGAVQATYSNTGRFSELKTPAIKVLINKANLTVSFVNKQNDTLSQAFNYAVKGAGNEISFKSDGKEAFYGGGSKAIELNKRGHILQNYNQAHYGYRYPQTDLNIAIPFLVSNRVYGLYVDNAAKSTFDVCKTDPNAVSFKATSGLMHFFFIGADNIDGVMANYTHLTGRQPLPPRWATGYITSRYGYRSEREVNNVIDKTQQAGIPLDAVVLDLYWYKSSSLMGNHNWSRDSFPDPQKMLTSLSNKGVKLIPISETYVTKKSENFKYATDNHLLTPDRTSYPEAHIFPRFWAGAAGLLDIFKPEAQQFYWSMYKDRIKEGVAGWWFDLAEPEQTVDSLRFAWGAENKVHNLYPLIWARTAFDGWHKDFPQNRVFTLIRSGYSGMQRYSTFPWSGDISRTFDGLKAQIPVMLNMGLSGVGYMHSDAGGFTGSKTGDPELYSRWLEFAAFTPIMRTHAEGYSPEPIFWDAITRERVTKYIKLRYQLLPYNYTMAYENTQTGRPLMMPVNYFEANNIRLANINDEYLWGEHLLVAPVIVQKQTTKKVLFPKGEWIGFNDFKAYKDSAEVSAPIDSLPLFVKAGSIIPMTAPITNTSQYDGKALILKYYSGSDSKAVKSEWFYDNGLDPNSLAKKQYDLVTFTTNSEGTTHHITITPQHLSDHKKSFRLVVTGKQIKSVVFSQKIVYKIADNGNKDSIEFTWNGQPVTLTVQTF